VAFSRLRISTLLCCALFPALLLAQSAPNPRQIISQARTAYYNLPNEGMDTFQCSVTPDWEALLQEQRKQNPAAADAAITILKQIRFVVALGSDGKIKLTHNELSGQTDQMKAALAQIYGGMEQMTSGFYETWSLFVMNPPLPPPESEYQLQTSGPVYLLGYTESTAQVATTLSKDFAVTELKVTTPEFDSVIHPEFIKTPKGLLLSGYTADYQSKDPGEATHLNVLLEYQEVDGVQMIRKLDLSGTYGGTPFVVSLAYSGCQVTKKPAVSAALTR